MRRVWPSQRMRHCPSCASMVAWPHARSRLWLLIWRGAAPSALPGGTCQARRPRMCLRCRRCSHSSVIAPAAPRWWLGRTPAAGSGCWCVGALRRGRHGSYSLRVAVRPFRSPDSTGALWRRLVAHRHATGAARRQGAVLQQPHDAVGDLAAPHLRWHAAAHVGCHAASPICGGGAGRAALVVTGAGAQPKAEAGLAGAGLAVAGPAASSAAAACVAVCRGCRRRSRRPPPAPPSQSARRPAAGRPGPAVSGSPAGPCVGTRPSWVLEDSLPSGSIRRSRQRPWSAQARHTRTLLGRPWKLTCGRPRDLPPELQADSQK